MKGKEEQMEKFRTDYKNDKLLVAENTKRKYKVTENSDGTVSLEDVTSYEVKGDSFGADEVNAIHEELNSTSEKIEEAVSTINQSLTLDFSNASEDVQNVNTLLQNLLDKFYPKIFSFIKTSISDWSRTRNTSVSIMPTLSIADERITLTKARGTESPNDNTEYVEYLSNVNIPLDSFLSVEGNVKNLSAVTNSIIVGVDLSTDSGTTWTNLFKVQTTTTNVESFNKKIDLSGYTNMDTIKIRFYGTESWGGIGYSINFTKFDIGS